ncbi:heptahelical transmembrane protein 4-like [Wolffia australiana]
MSTEMSNSQVGGDLCVVDEEENINSGEQMWKKVKYQLVEYHSLPAYLKDNEYILGYYRSEWPLKHILLSIFTIHNETLNVWTHLIGFFIFLALTVYTAMKIPSVVELPDLHKMQLELLNYLASLPHIPDLHSFRDELKTAFPSMDALSSSGRHLLDLLYGSSHSNTTHISFKEKLVGMKVWGGEPTSRWPFFVFLGGAMFCLLASSACHLLFCHSRRLAYIMLRLDYAGIAALIAASFYPPVYYSFLCNPGFCVLYLSAITVLGATTVVASLLPVFESPKFRPLRAGLFFAMGVSGVVPVLHKLAIFHNRPEALHTAAYEVLMGLLYGLGALLYATRVPERWRPGWFDVAGHSHQLFHVLVVAGAFTHYKAGLVYLRWRDAEGC